MTAAPVRFRVLGPLEWHDGRGWRPIGAAKQRALLAVLLINANRTVSADQLTAQLWGEQPPASAGSLLAGYVWRLRRLLGDRDSGTLTTRAPGYRLVLSPGATDVDEYTDLVATGRRQLADGDLAGAAGTLGTALGMWRGAPLADVALVPAVLSESARLEEARLAVVETRLEAEIGLGRHEELLPELKQLISQFPLRERLHAHLMVALYRTGQQAEALGAYRDLRRLLVDELGIEPSKPLRELHGRVLREDQSLLATGTPPVTAVPRLALARTLPPDVPVFVARDAELSQVTARLTSGAQRCAIHGMAGVGKTALAVHAAHRVAEHFPDGQLYLDLAAAGGPGRALAALGITGADLPEAAALLRAALAGRRVLLVLDNVADPTEVDQLLPAAAGCAALLAGRAASATVTGPGLVRLRRLPPAAATELLRHYADRDRLAAAPAATARLAQLCEYLPLALRVAATRLARRPEWTVGDFVHRLADPRRRLDALACDGLSVRTSLAAGARLLRRRADRLASCALARLGGLDLPMVSTPVLARLLDVADAVAEATAERLVDAGLIEARGMDRYLVPELVRLFARTEFGNAADEHTATGRVVGYYEGAVRGQLAQLDVAGRAAGLAWYRQESLALRALAEPLPRTELRQLLSDLNLALRRPVPEPG